MYHLSTIRCLENKDINIFFKMNEYFTEDYYYIMDEIGNNLISFGSDNYPEMVCENPCICEDCSAGRPEFCEEHVCDVCCENDADSEYDYWEDPDLTELRTIICTIDIEGECSRGKNVVVATIRQPLIDKFYNDLNVELYFLHERAKVCGFKLLKYYKDGIYTLELEKKKKKETQGVRPVSPF